MNLRIAVATLASASLLIAGCSSDDEPAGPPASVPIDDQIVEVAADLAALYAQMDLQKSECMEVEGFPYFARSAQEHLATLVEAYSLGILSLSVEDAQLNGYTNTGESSAAANEEQTYFEAQSQAETDAYQLVLFGTLDQRREISTPSGSQLTIPIGGCLGQAAEVVYGSVDSYADGEIVFNELQDLMGRISFEVNDTDEFNDALGLWSSCMGEAGLQFGTPSDAREAAVASREDPDEGSDDDSEPPSSTEAADPPQVGAEEREIAVADATCQAEVSLPEVFTDLALVEQSRVIAESERVFLSWDELVRRIEAEGYSGVAQDGDDLLSGSAAKS